MELINFDLLKFLSSCSIEYGILDGDGEQKVNVNILNTDNTVTETKMKVKDVMFFTEYGTITIPGRFILEKLAPEVDQIINHDLDQILDDILYKEENRNSIRNKIDRLCLKIQDRIRQRLETYIKETNTLGSIIHPGKDDNKYIYNLLDLRKYIKCRAKFRN